MPFTVMLSPDAKEYLDSLDDKRARNIRKHLKELEKDPSSREQPEI
jgi:mRNA-degrading endonuclease RelE of RelBE toxin-antitoxin system